MSPPHPSRRLGQPTRRPALPEVPEASTVTTGPGLLPVGQVLVGSQGNIPLTELEKAGRANPELARQLQGLQQEALQQAEASLQEDPCPGVTPGHQLHIPPEIPAEQMGADWNAEVEAFLASMGRQLSSTQVPGAQEALRAALAPAPAPTPSQLPAESSQAGSRPRTVKTAPRPPQTTQTPQVPQSPPTAQPPQNMPRRVGRARAQSSAHSSAPEAVPAPQPRSQETKAQSSAPSSPREPEMVAGTDTRPSFCPHCNYDLVHPREPIPIEASDRLAYLLAMDHGQRFVKEVVLYGGRMQVVFRSLTPRESDLAYRQTVLDSSEAQRDSSLPTSGEGWYNLMIYRLALGLQSISTTQGGKLEIEPFGSFMAQKQPGESDLRAYARTVLEAAFPTENLRRVIGDLFFKFDLLIERLDAQALEDPFWQAIGAPGS